MTPICRLSVAFVCLLLASYVGAEDKSDDAKDKNLTVFHVKADLDTEQLQYVLAHGRKKVLKRGMVLDPKQTKAFWSVYRQYEEEREQLDAKRLRLLGTYVNRFSTLTNDDATRLIKLSLSNQRHELALRQKYFRILSQKLNPVVAARFAQLDDFVGMVTRLAILGHMPLIRGSMPEQAAHTRAPASQSTPR